MGCYCLAGKVSLVSSLGIIFFRLMPSVQYLTVEGLEKLKQELQGLKTVARRDIASRIETAKALGDLSENAEYHEAKDAMALNEGRIHEIEEVLKNIEIIDTARPAANRDLVRVGSSVNVMVNGKEKTFSIVGSTEADPASGKISNESPIGSHLLDRKAGDRVSIPSPGGTVVYDIISIA